MPDHVHGDLDVLQRPAQLLGDFLVLPRFEQLQWFETICQATPPLPFTLSIWISRHSRMSRAPTPAGSSDCTTRSAAATCFDRVVVGLCDLFERIGRYPSSSRLPMIAIAASRTVSESTSRKLRLQVIAKCHRGRKNVSKDGFSTDSLDGVL